MSKSPQTKIFACSPTALTNFAAPIGDASNEFEWNKIAAEVTFCAHNFAPTNFSSFGLICAALTFQDLSIETKNQTMYSKQVT